MRLSDRLNLAFAVEAIAGLVKAGMLAGAWCRNGALPRMIWAHVAGNTVTGLGYSLSPPCRRSGRAFRDARSLSVIVPGREIVRFQMTGFAR